MTKINFFLNYLTSVMATPNAGEKVGDLASVRIANTIFSANGFQLTGCKHAGIIRHKCGCEDILKTRI